MAVRIKICSICRPEDAIVASLAGANLAGLIFHPASARAVNVEQAKPIVAALLSVVTPVGVFVNSDPAAIEGIAGAVGIRCLQLHGQESREDCVELRRRGYQVLKALKVTEDLPAEVERYRGCVDAIVLDTATPKGHGGTGVPNDWALVERFGRAGVFDGIDLIASGGLTAETVGEVVHRIRPSAVDVSSGVEAVVREKSAEKVRAFVRAVRAAEASRK